MSGGPQNFDLLRLDEDGRSSIARLQNPGGQLLCYGLEPGPAREPHPWIPPGRYELKLRTQGQKHMDYAKHYAASFGIGWHKGMVEISGVPLREAIEFHCGNTVADTLGCILSGESFLAPPGNGSGHYEVMRSRSAYERVYPILRNAILDGGAILHVRPIGVS
jgi:hypothetical protein